jgi:hypothetical protein
MHIQREKIEWKHRYANSEKWKKKKKKNRQSFKIKEMDEMPICEMIKCSLANTLRIIPMLFEPLV